jgi:hypothetical protein
MTPNSCFSVYSTARTTGDMPVYHSRPDTEILHHCVFTSTGRHQRLRSHMMCYNYKYVLSYSLGLNQAGLNNSNYIINRLL